LLFGRLQPVIVTGGQIYPVLHPTDVGTDREEPYGFGALIGLAEAMRRAKRAVNSPAECNFVVKRAGHACRSVQLLLSTGGKFAPFNGSINSVDTKDGLSIFVHAFSRETPFPTGRESG
jgi:hypothetical protein